MHIISQYLCGFKLPWNIELTFIKRYHVPPPTLVSHCISISHSTSILTPFVHPIGPGFDVIGLALSMYLELRVSIDRSAPKIPNNPLNCTVSYSGVGAEDIDLNPENNLLTRTALYVLRCHNQHDFPAQTSVHIHNPIPLGRGLGSSGAAVVAGVLLGDIVGDLKLPKPRLLDFCLMVERHPDNVAAALYGGFVGTYLNELDPEDMARKEVPLSEVLPQPAGGIDTGLTPPIPPENIGHYRRFNWAKEIKAVAIIPNFEVSTAKAREVLPKSYSRQDMVSGQAESGPQLKGEEKLLNDHHLMPDLQPPAPCAPHDRPVRQPSGPRFDLLGDARQNPPTVPKDADPRAAGHPVLNVAQDAQGPFGHLPFRCWADDIGTRHREFRDHC